MPEPLQSPLQDALQSLAGLGSLQSVPVWACGRWVPLWHSEGRQAPLARCALGRQKRTLVLQSRRHMSPGTGAPLLGAELMTLLGVDEWLPRLG